jgi:hypothetical protein
MAGAWELPRVLVAILTREIVTTKWASGFRNLHLPEKSDVVFLSGMPFDHARNHAVQLALDHGFTHLFFLDDDVIPPPDAISRLTIQGAPITSGLYYRRAAPLLPVALYETEQGPAHIVEFPGDLIWADLVGAGCLLIETDVLRKIPAPWFQWTIDRHDLPESQRCSEDFYFCRRAREYGFKIVVNSTVRCQHVGLSSSLDGSLSPLHC